MKLLKILARVLPHSWFVVLLYSSVCRCVRIRLISRSFESCSKFICYRLEYTCENAFGIKFYPLEMQLIFRMDNTEAVLHYGAIPRYYPFLGAAWWDSDDLNREKYHNSLFFKQ